MMRRLLIAAPVLLVCALPYARSSPNVQVSASGVIDNYARACGGPALATITTEVRKGTLVRGQFGQIPLEIVSKAPGKWRYSQTFAWGDQVCRGSDGTTGWVQDGTQTVPMDSRQLLDLRLLLDPQAPLKMRELFPVLSVTGSEKVGDRDAVTIAATSRDGCQTTMAFDGETGLLLRAGEMLFEDYRSVGSVKRPFRILLGKNEGEKHLQMAMQLTETRHDAAVDDSLFQQPSCVLPQLPPPLHKTRQQIEVSTEALDVCVGVYKLSQDPGYTYTVTRQGSHLMMQRSGWSTKLEIKPESDRDYFVEFLNFEFHFVKDALGKVTRLEIGADRARTAERIQ